MINLAVFIQQTFIECLLYARFCSRHGISELSKMTSRELSYHTLTQVSSHSQRLSLGALSPWALWGSLGIGAKQLQCPEDRCQPWEPSSQPAPALLSTFESLPAGTVSWSAFSPLCGHLSLKFCVSVTQTLSLALSQVFFYVSVSF